MLESAASSEPVLWQHHSPTLRCPAAALLRHRWTQRAAHIALHGGTQHGSTSRSCLRTRLRVFAKMQRLFLVARRGRRPSPCPIAQQHHRFSPRRGGIGLQPSAGHHIQPQMRCLAPSHRAVVHSPAARRLPGGGRILISKAVFTARMGKTPPKRRRLRTPSPAARQARRHEWSRMRAFELPDRHDAVS